MINTLTIARKLAKSGIKREQAEAIADIVADAVNPQNGNLATTEFVRTHVGELQKGTDGKIDSIRVEIGDLRIEISELRSEISELRSDMETQIASVRVEISEVRVEISALDAKISATEVRIVRWLIGIGLTLGLYQGALQFFS